MSIFTGKKKVLSTVDHMSDRQILEYLYREINELKDRFDDLEANSEMSETAELKSEIRENAKFMQQLVLESIGAVRDKAAKPSAAELYMKDKKEREERERIDAEKAKEKAAEKLAKRNGGEKVVV